MPTPLIDWIVAEWVAGQIAGGGDHAWPDVDLEPLAVEAQRRVVDYTGLVPNAPLPPPEPVSRQEWVASNITSSRALLDPVLEKAGSGLGSLQPFAQIAVGAIASAEVGLLIGYLGKRVMGQYEIVLLDRSVQKRDPRLLFVMPNLGEAVARFDADPQEFLTWVTLHEVTHAVQFGGVPWLQGYLAGLIGELTDSAEQRIDAKREKRSRLRDREELRRMLRAARHADLIGIVTSESERAVLDRAQAVMAVIEGHAEHVMDAVAPDLLPSLPQLRSKLDSRRSSQSFASRLIGRLLGMDLKMKQYQQGKVFCDAIVREGGVAALRHVFSAPEALPTLAEIEAPRTWLLRIGEVH